MNFVWVADLNGIDLGAQIKWIKIVDEFVISWLLIIFNCSNEVCQFHKYTFGKAWTSEYGNPDDPRDFDFIYPISPLHNIPKGQVLPPFHIMAADHDDRVVPMHSFKMTATLQHMAVDNPHPLLIAR